jgi:hypothetical protein
LAAPNRQRQQSSWELLPNWYYPDWPGARLRDSGSAAGYRQEVRARPFRPQSCGRSLPARRGNCCRSRRGIRRTGRGMSAPGLGNMARFRYGDVGRQWNRRSRRARNCRASHPCCRRWGIPMLAHQATRELKPRARRGRRRSQYPASVIPEACAKHLSSLRQLEGPLRSLRNSILPFNLRRRFSCEAISASFDETADSSADFRAISLSRNLKSKFVLI